MSDQDIIKLLRGKMAKAVMLINSHQQDRVVTLEYVQGFDTCLNLIYDIIQQIEDLEKQTK